MPQVTFLGPFYARRYPDGKGEFIRNSAVTVTQIWLDTYRGHLPVARFRIEGDEPPMIDEGNDGIPDREWTVKKIRSWLDGYGMKPSGYATKGSLLKLVDNALNPELAEDVIVEVEAQIEVPDEEVTEENNSEIDLGGNEEQTE